MYNEVIFVCMAWSRPSTDRSQIISLNSQAYSVQQQSYEEALYQVYGPLLSVHIDVLKVKVKVHTLDIAPLRSESTSQKRSGMARVLEGFHTFTCTPTRLFATGMSHTCLCLPSYN